MNIFSFALSSLAGLILSPFSLGQAASHNLSQELFNSLEELARIVDITYCVGTTGVSKPFRCLSRCDDFPGFELVTTWHTGPLLSDSCGYIALSHPPHPKRIIVAFRGTYSIANTIADLSTIPAVYVPFPANGGDGDDICASASEKGISYGISNRPSGGSPLGPRCEHCTVHFGFMTSWKNTRCIVIPPIEKALAEFPDHQLTLVGHSLGGAVAALASLEFEARGWKPHVTTFGEPRIGNQAFNHYFNECFNLSNQDPSDSTYRRVTHVGDPVPVLPLKEWGYHAHAGEIFISKSDLPPALHDVEHCIGDEDPNCIAGPTPPSTAHMMGLGGRDFWHMPSRFRLWQLFFAHRDYFWRLGLCVPHLRDKWPEIQPPTETEEL